MVLENEEVRRLSDLLSHAYSFELDSDEFRVRLHPGDKAYDWMMENKRFHAHRPFLDNSRWFSGSTKDFFEAFQTPFKI